MIKQDIETLIRADEAAVRQLESVRDYGPAGAFIAAGFVRNRVWDAIYSNSAQPFTADVDVVYFDGNKVTPEHDYGWEAALRAADTETDWQVRNQARMHLFHGFPAFGSLAEGLMHWAETATSVGVRLDENDTMHFIAPFGFDDLQNHILRITPAMKEKDPLGFDARLNAKGWARRWPKLRVIR